MELEMRPPTADEMVPFVASVALHFGVVDTPEESQMWARAKNPSRYLGVYDAGELVATSGAWDIELTLPGLVSVPVAGVTAVGVAPTHRRQGLLNRMMTRMLDDAVERGEPIAILTASESVIYGRYGFGWATSLAEAQIDCDHGAYDLPHGADGRIRRIDKDAVLKVVPGLYEKVRRQTVGDISGPNEYFDRLTADFESHRDGASAFFYALHENGAGEPDGFMAYRYKNDWPHGNPKSAVIVPEFFGATPGAEAALLRYLLDLDLVARVRLDSRPVDDHLRRRLANPRRYEIHGMGDHVWLRLVDVEAGLPQRRYNGDGEVVVEVVDRFRPQNDGRYRVGNAGCGRAPEAEPDVVLPVESLGAAYLGGVTFASLARAGRAAEGRAGGLGRADALFGEPVLPYCHHGF